MPSTAGNDDLGEIRRCKGWETSMTKAELISAIAEKAGLNKNQSRDALEAFLSSVTDSLKSGKEVRLVGFGSFVPVARKAGTARNPRTGETVKRAASKTARFRVGEGLKTALN
jgi:DNA-binding protein HU-beta